MDYDLHWRDSLNTYRSHPTTRHCRRFVVRALRRYAFTPTTFVFDYGRGTGLVLDDIRRAFRLRSDQVGGCDTSKEAILQARQDLSSAELYSGSFPTLLRQIGVAVCTEVIEHVPDYRQIQVWLRDRQAPGGVLILTTLSVPMDPPDEWYGHIRHFELEANEQLGARTQLPRREVGDG